MLLSQIYHWLIDVYFVRKSILVWGHVRWRRDFAQYLRRIRANDHTHFYLPPDISAICQFANHYILTMSDNAGCLPLKCPVKIITKKIRMRSSIKLCWFVFTRPTRSKCPNPKRVVAILTSFFSSFIRAFSFQYIQTKKKRPTHPLSKASVALPKTNVFLGWPHGLFFKHALNFGFYMAEFLFP